MTDSRDIMTVQQAITVTSHGRRTDGRFRILYAVGMVAVVTTHCSSGGLYLLQDWFDSWYLGIFVFAAGYFYRFEEERHPLRYIGKKAKHLLIPLYLWNFAYALIVTLMGKLGFTMGVGITWRKIFLFPLTNGHQFSYNLAAWFVAPLFMVETVMAIVRFVLPPASERKWVVIKETALSVLFIAAGVTGVRLARAGLNTGWFLVLDRLLYFLPFFQASVLYRRVLEYHDRLRNTEYFVVVFLFNLLLCIVNKGLPTYVYSWCSFTGNALMPFLAGFTGIAFWLRAARVMDPVMGRSRIVTLIAGSTFSIMENQYLGFMAVKGLFYAAYRFLHRFPTFDVAAFRTQYNYFFLPYNVTQTRILYVIAGIFLPVLIQQILTRIKHSSGRFIFNNRQLRLF